MANNYKKENYARNKYSKGIVYSGPVCSYEITLEQFLKENPNMTQADFEYWKNVSDEIYKEEDKATLATTRNNVSINELEETKFASVESAEVCFFNSEKILTKEDVMNAQFIYGIAKKALTESQYTRFLAFFSEGKTMTEIANAEGVSHTSIVRSISLSKKKIKKILGNICTKHSIFDDI